MTVPKCPASGDSSTSASKCPFTGPSKVVSYPNAAKANDKGIITGLSNKRSSDGMGLPEAISPSNIDLIVATAPVVAPRMLDITKCFYTNVLAEHPGLLQFFNPAVRVVVVVIYMACNAMYITRSVYCVNISCCHYSNQITVFFASFFLGFVRFVAQRPRFGSPTQSFGRIGSRLRYQH